MKRSIDDVEILPIEKRVKRDLTECFPVDEDTYEIFDTSSSQSSDSSSSSDSSQSSEEDVVPEQFSDLEKHIVNKSLAMIGRTNPHDWDYERDCMTLIESTSYPDFLETYIYYTLEVTVWRGSKLTGVNIEYTSESGVKNNINLYWHNDPVHTSFEVVRYTTNWWFWTNEEHILLQPEDIRSDSWCYFQDIRDHINYIYISFP